MQIFIARPDKTHGPYSIDVVNAYLASGHLRGDDMAWCEGNAAWVPLSQIGGVLVPPTSTPATLPSAPPQPAPPSFLTGAMPSDGFQSEQTVFDIRPSPTPDLLLIPFTCGLSLLRLIANQGIKYRLTTQRLIVTTGLVSQRVEEVELYRIQDVTLVQGVGGRLCGFGTVVVHVNDASTPRLFLSNVQAPLRVKEQIRECFRAARRHEGVRAIEYAPSRP